MGPNVAAVIMAADVDQTGRPMALVIYRNRSWVYIPHSELDSER